MFICQLYVVAGENVKRIIISCQFLSKIILGKIREDAWNCLWKIIAELYLYP